MSASKTYFGSGIRAGEGTSELPSGVGVGAAVLCQTVTLQAATAANVDGTIQLPAGGRILNIYADSTVAWTAATASLTVGDTAGGEEYVSATDVKTVTRGPAAFTAAQLAAFNYGSSTKTIYARVASGTPNATGTTKVTVLYTMG